MIPSLLLILACVFYRVALAMSGASEWMNFCPVTALVLCGAIYLPRPYLWVFPLITLGVSDLVLNAFYHAALFTGEMLVRYLIMGGMVWAACIYRGRLRALPKLFTATVGSSLGFYLTTNSASWWQEPGYAKSIHGWLQALTTGLPGYPPTWLFLRNSLVSDLLFTALFVLCISCFNASPSRPAEVGQTTFKKPLSPAR